MARDPMKQHQQQDTFDDWFAQHRGLFFKVARAHAFTPHDRDDLFQEIAAQVWHSIPNFRGECAVTTWIYRVALHCAMAWSWKEKRRRDRRQDLDQEVPPRILTAERVDRRLEWLFEQIAQLEDIDRALTLLLLDGFSHREMATTLGLSETNVGVKIHRIKNQLVQKSREEEHHGL